MRLRNGILTLVFAYLSTATADCGSKTAFYFANGMFNDKDDARISLNAVENLLVQNYPKKAKQIIKWQVAYNTNEPVLRQLWQVFDQKRTEVAGNFWSSLIPLMQKSNDAAIQIQAILSNVSEEQLQKDADLKLQVRNYQEDLIKGLKIITVAHSQGNFYSLFAFDLIPEHADLLHLISVATPMGRSLKGRYVNLKSDRVITSIPGSLPPNATKLNPGLFDHRFIEDYLASDEPKSLVLDFFQSAANDSVEERDLADYEWPIVEKDSFDSSLDPIVEWIKIYLKNPHPLDPYQCLLIFTLMDLQAITNIKCEERTLQDVESAIEDCGDELKGNPRKKILCPFYDLGTRMSSAIELQEIKFRELNPKCNWLTFADLRQSGLTVTDINKTKALIKKLTDVQSN